MKVAAALGLYALLLALLPARFLARAAWAGRSPRWGVALWQALSASALLAAAAAGFALALPALRLSGDLSQVLRECVMALRAQYASPGGALTAASGAVLAMTVLGSSRLVRLPRALHRRRGSSRAPRPAAVDRAAVRRGPHRSSGPLGRAAR